MDRVIEHRRNLHKIPELGFELAETVAYVTRRLEACVKCETGGVAGGIYAYFDAGKRKTIAFRADMDALPIQEKGDSPYASLHPGKMHACGHDGHTAMLLALAEYLNDNMPAQKYNVLLIFQPAEETTGGALGICETGLLEKKKVFAIFGLHLFPDVPTGRIATRPGPLMARSGEMTIQLTGKSVHIAKAAEGCDCAEAIGLLLTRLYEMERTALPKECLRLLKFGSISAGTVRNALASSGMMLGSLRAFSDGDFELLRDRAAEICAAVQKQTGCRVSMHLSQGYPAVCNDRALTETVFSAIPETILYPAPSMTSEDFAFYGKYVPAVFAFLGTGMDIPLHSADFDFDESCLLGGVEYYKRLLYLDYNN